MDVFVSGASGYIGCAVAAELARAGHKVFGLTRKPGAARRLESMEIVPLIGDMDSPESYLEIAASCSCVVHCGAEYTERYMELDASFVGTLLERQARSGTPRRFIYTSGVWVYGDTGADWKDESSSLAPPAMVEPRVATESRVLQASSGQLKTVVLRPGCVYGGSGSLTAAWFASARDSGSASAVGGERARWAMVHLADLAVLYRLAVESGCCGEVFNGVSSCESVMECARAASRVSGSGGAVTVLSDEAAARQFGPMAQCLAFCQLIDSGKAERMLGWRPRHRGFAQAADLYFRAWRAAI